MNSFILYLLVSWLPTLLTGAGWLPAQAIRAMAFNQLGGIVGGLSLAWLMDRFGAERTLAIGFAINAVALLLFLVVPSGFFSWGALLLLIGACTGGSIVRDRVAGSIAISVEHPRDRQWLGIGDSADWCLRQPAGRRRTDCRGGRADLRDRRSRRTRGDIRYFDAGAARARPPA